MIPATPDLDALVLEALRAANLGADVRVMVPTNPAENLPLVVAHQVPGGSTPGMGSITGNIELKALAATRREASLLARNAYAALIAACRARFQGTDGHLGWFRPVGGAPTEQRVGEPAPTPNLFVFRTTVSVTARATLTPGG